MPQMSRQIQPCVVRPATVLRGRSTPPKAQSKARSEAQTKAHFAAWRIARSEGYREGAEPDQTMRKSGSHAPALQA